MNKNISLVLVFLSLFSSIVIQEVKAESMEAILIDDDGLILGTDKIHREGNLYTLTDNIYHYPIIVQQKQHNLRRQRIHPSGRIRLVKWT